MDELENQQLPAEHEDTPEPAVTEEAAAPEETAAPKEPAVPEEPEADSPVFTESAPEPEIPFEPQIPQRPLRRSPYENSPYMMPHQPQRQAPPQPEAPVQEKPVRPKKKRGCLLLFVLVSLLLFMNFLTARWGAEMAEDRAALRIQSLEEQIGALQAQLEAQGSTGESISGTPNASADGSLTPAQVYARNQQSVVLIETDVATGSGFVLTDDGYVVTNYHVVEDGAYIRVVMHDRSYHDAALVGYEASNDVALLKMEGTGFPAVTLGSSDDLIVGDLVAAIGNPLGELTSTLTVGYVSAKERDVSTDTTVISMIQTDCAINSGNSGGPLFNMKGEVVGITSAKYSGLSASGASIEGIGFAIPMDDAMGILADLMAFGYVKSAYLGVSVYTLEPGSDQPLGCLVDSVTPGGCAEKAGILKGDIIIGLGGHTIRGYTDLTRVLREFEGGESTTITVYREGQGELTLSIILDAKPREEATDDGEKEMPENGSYEEWYEYFFGE